MSQKEASAHTRAHSIFHYLGYSLAGVTLLVGGIFVYQRVEQFLISNPRFVMRPPEEYGEDSPNLQIEGARHASRVQLVQAFAEDFGRSIYLCPLKKRRLSLLAVSWVKDASVMRIWPNRALVRIVEREPVAFVPLPTRDPQDGARLALIDEEGVLLEPRNPAEFRLPVLVGVRAEESREMRRARVRRMQKFLSEAGQFRDRFSEIDVTALENLQVTFPVEGTALTLILGEGHYGVKLRNFFANYEAIRQRLPWAKVLDLRVEDRVTAIGGGSRSE